MTNKKMRAASYICAGLYYAGKGIQVAGKAVADAFGDIKTVIDEKNEGKEEPQEVVDEVTEDTPA